MAFSSWRGVVGMINPTMRPGVTEEVIRLLPEGIGLIPLFLNIRRGTVDEFAAMMPAYEELVAVLAECGCDLIHPHGAPPFMVQGRKREAEIVRAWEKKYKTPIMSVAQNHVNALKTLKAKTILGATYFPPKLNAIFAKYFRDAGFTVRAMAGIDVPFDKVQADVAFRELVEGARFEIGPVKVSCARLNHPYVAIGYRLDFDGHHAGRQRTASPRPESYSRSRRFDRLGAFGREHLSLLWLRPSLSRHRWRKRDEHYPAALFFPSRLHRRANSLEWCKGLASFPACRRGLILRGGDYK